MSVELVTFTGKRVSVDTTTPEMIDVRDIAHGLSLQCRFNGQCREFYSVAEHCVRVSYAVEEAYVRAYQDEICSSKEKCQIIMREARLMAFRGLLHDAPEAYIGDVITQIKRTLALFQFYEIVVAGAISEWSGAGDIEPPIVKQYDSILFVTEVRDIHPHPEMFNITADILPLDDRIVPWPAHVAEREWLDRFYQLNEVVEQKPLLGEVT